MLKIELLGNVPAPRGSSAVPRKRKPTLSPWPYLILRRVDLNSVGPASFVLYLLLPLLHRILKMTQLKGTTKPCGLTSMRRRRLQTPHNIMTMNLTLLTPGLLYTLRSTWRFLPWVVVYICQVKMLMSKLMLPTPEVEPLAPHPEDLSDGDKGGSFRDHISAP
ncbi:hypothetical protein Tco_0928866 [Tanacetum coccineum]